MCGPILQLFCIALCAISQPFDRKKYKNGSSCKYTFEVISWILTDENHSCFLLYTARCLSVVFGPSFSGTNGRAQNICSILALVEVLACQFLMERFIWCILCHWKVNCFMNLSKYQVWLYFECTFILNHGAICNFC